MITREEKAEQIEKKFQEEEHREKTHKRIGLFLKIFFLLLTTILCFYLYMRFVSTSGLKVNEIKVVKENLPTNFHGFKIVHFSDLHYGSTYREKEIINLTKKINELKPDLIIFTGDLIDRDAKLSEEEIETLTIELKKMNATTKKYAIKGNHDYNNQFDSIFPKADFTILNNQGELLYYKGYDPILVTGIGSSIKGDDHIEEAFSYFQSETANRQIFSLAFLHEPDSIDEEVANYPVNLALSGHSHLGQVRLPGIGPMKTIRGAKKYKEAHYQLNDTDLYISGGLGTTTYKLRFFNRPSINFYRLVTK